MAGGDTTLWDAQANGNAEGVERLSRMVAGNDRLVAEPGLVQALYQSNATPQQSQALNQFLVGLDAENAVHAAVKSASRIALTADQTDALDAMGVDYSSVIHTQQDAVTQLRQQMAAKGLQPVTDANGNIKTDAAGNPLTQVTDTTRLAAVKKKVQQGGFFSSNPFDSIGNFFVNLYHGRAPWSPPSAISRDTHDAGVPSFSPQQAVEGLNEGYNWISATLSSTNPAKPGYFQAQAQNRALAQQLGYDPDSFFSMQAYKARGYQHDDTSKFAQQWDDAGGKFGWDGQTAVTEAEVFAADPNKYLKNIASDTSLSPEQAASKLKAVSSPEFQTLVKQVNGSRADIGADTARGLGIDPVEHSTEFNIVSTGTNLAAQFAIDPIAFGLKVYTAKQVASVGIKGFTDAGGISRILNPEDLGKTTAAQRKTIFNLRDMVTHSNDLRAAVDAGDTVKAAAIHAKLGTNPFGGLVGDFLGKDQIVGFKSEHELQNLGKGDLPFRYGPGEAIDTYDKAVNYLASKGAMLRLQGGLAPVETAVMPGALSSYGYLKMKGGLQALTAGRTAGKAVDAAARFIETAKRTGQVDTLVKDGFLTRTLPHDTDAVDVLSGKVIAAERKSQVADDLLARARDGLTESQQTLSRAAAGTDGAATADALANHAQHGFAVDLAAKDATSAKAELASALRARSEASSVVSDSEVAITDAGRGLLRGNKIRYGTFEAPTTAAGKFLSAYTLGLGERAKLFASRFTNWLTRDTSVDITSAASADAVRKVARTYMTSGDANMLSMRWVVGDEETRKTIMQGLRDQLTHAANLTRTKAGKELIEEWRSDSEKYATTGREFVDANGRNGAQWPGQVQTKFALPNFGAVHKAAAKIGLYEGTMGRLLGSTPVEKLLMQWKIQVLFTPVTAMRANIESWLNGHAEGMFKSGVQAKALLRDEGQLDGEVARSRTVDKILSLAPLQAAGRFYRHVAQRGMDENVAEAIRTMPADLRQGYVHDQAMNHYAMSVDPAGVGEATAIAQQGYRAVRANLNSKAGFDAAVRTRKGYEVTDEVDGVSGANLYAHNLGLRVNKAPNVAKAVIERIEKPELGSDHVVAALESGAAENLMKHSLFGKVFIRDDGTQARAVTDAEVALGKQQWADQITEEFRQIITGRNGVVQSKITGYIKTHGKAPDADWILDNVKKMNRPQALLKPIFDASPRKDGVGGLLDDLMDAEGKGYQWLVERLIQRHTTTPMFAAAYGRAKVDLEGFKQQLIGNGFSDLAAERATATAAAQQAWHRIALMVDDPRLKSQMDIVGRSFFAFSRATTTMLRRWGSTFWRNPAQARRYQLAAEAAVHSGIVYTDPSTGQWMFHFPASGVAQEALFHAASVIPGLQGLAQFPVSDFTGRVASIIPGSDNPFQYNTNPIVSISGRTVASLFPQYRSWFDEVDRKLNGTAGQGQGFWATLEPNLVKKFTDPLSDDRNSITTSAMVGSLYNLYAAGLTPPEGASPSQVEDFLGRLQTQTKSQLYLRAIFGVFSPASIGVPENENSASKPDFAFAEAGAQGLRDEFKTLLNDTDGDFARAAAIWTALHPDLTVYTQSGSTASVSHAVMPATQAALGWMNTHLDFLGKYKSVAAFFIPEQSAGDPYSQAAYRAQLEEGLRQRKTPAEFLDTVRYATAANTYYAMEDKYTADLAAAKQAGNDQLASQHRADWLAWSHQFKAAHPVFAQHTESSVANVVTAQQQMADLKLMVKNRQVPGGLGPAVAGMIEAYDGYRQFVAAHPGGTNVAQAARASASSQLQDYLSAVVAARPDLGDVYRGVFRVLDNQLS